MKNHTYAKQLARFPYCRIYRHFFNRLTENCQIRKQGEGLLYRYMSLFSLVNFRPALRTVHGQRYVIQAGEWVASYSELKERLHLPTYTQIFVDPILGDDGKLYNGVSDAAVTYSQKLCSVADVIVPNITEACFLTGAAPKGRYTEEEITEILRQLHALGAKAVVITSTNLAGQMVTVVQDSPQAPWQALAYEEIPVRFPGTGDLFMAMVVGQYLKTGNLPASVHHAMQVLEQMIRANLHDSDTYKGIPVEQFLEVFCDEKA